MNKRLNLLLFSGEYDKALAALILANGAKENGMDVTIFCAFWGLLVIRKEGYENSIDKTISQKMFEKMIPKNAEDLNISNMNFLGAGQRMLKHMMKESDKPMLKDFLDGARHKNVKFYACKLSQEVMGFTKEELIDEAITIEVDQYLKDALESDIQLFI
ncbi:DsrE/DsrF/DrsH-like family protein [Clostridium sp. D2Q-14]|uniref:DsrE/DsrF/DrsH-like family protein n=1 Tax=Anaeromonas gelatinilytica TaxID=2683194 RepID=UPI00193BE6AF|nr:DsrE/DsrF/DrsH-like family protein [Anaeromonas gelatinilytica]MBS4534465.1 DsrE/DsrF/DrsH-like family protein [Anaeromonas gelatinilytica]